MVITVLSERLTIILRLLILLLGGSWSSLGSSRGLTSSSSSWGGGGVSIRVGDAVLELVDGLPLVVNLNGSRDEVLVAVDKRVHDRWKSGEVGSQGDGGNGGDGRGEGLEELALLNVEDAGSEGLTLVVDLGDTHTVGEGRDVQHVEESSLGSTNFATSLDELQIGGNFNGTTGDLGGDTESLEERGLAGLHTGVSGGDVDVGGGDGTSTSRGSDTVGQDLLAGLLEVTVGEDESDVACAES